MSLDYLVVCQDSRPILRDEIAQTLAIAGWDSVTVESFFDDRLKPAESPYLNDGNATIGWRKESKHAAFHAALIKTGDRNAIEQKCYEENELGHVSWGFKPSFSLCDDIGYESDQEAAQDIDAEILGMLRTGQCLYETSYLSNMPFAIAALATIAKLRSGLIHDPQIGCWFMRPANMSEVPELAERWEKLAIEGGD